MTRIFPFVITLFAVFIGTAKLHGQASNLQYQVANLVEDVRILDERLRNMEVRLDEMRRENSRLSELVSDYESQADSQRSKFITVGQLNDAIRKSVEALERRDNMMKNEIIDEVKKTVAKLADAIDIPSVPKPNAGGKTYFPTEGIPQTGIPYTVVPGDSIASIAKKLNSRVDWIQNRNMIADPRLLQVGQVILVPQQAE